MKTVLSDLDGILLRIGKYENKRELIKDALRALLRAKPELRRDVANFRGGLMAIVFDTDILSMFAKIYLCRLS